MSSIIAIADAIVALLITGNNAAWFPMPVETIERRWAPDLEIADVASLRISVVPRLESRTRVTRDTDALGPTVDIALMQHLPQSTDSRTNQVDVYATMAQAVADIIVRDQLPALPDVRLVGLVHDPLIDQARLVANRCIFSVISTTWRYQAVARQPLPGAP